MSKQRYYMDLDAHLASRLQEVAAATGKSVEEVFQQCVTVGLATIACTLELFEMMREHGPGPAP